MAQPPPMDPVGQGDQEAARIEAIQKSGVLDIPGDEQLDRITRMAAQVFDVPVAMVTVVDEEIIWVKSSVGFEPTCLDRAPGLCESILRANAVRQIPDARLDPVAKFHPLVDVDSGVVFYAGAPVRNRENRVLGTVCIADVVARTMSERELATLQDFADWVMDLIELHRAQRERDASERRLRILSENPSLLVAETDQAGILRHVSTSVESILGYSQQETEGRHFLNFIHSNSQQSMADDFKSVIEGGFVKSSGVILHRDGSQRIFEFASSPVISDEEEIRTVTVLIDVTERIEAESKVAMAQKRYRQLFETSRDGIAFLSLSDGMLAEVNGTMCSMFGYQKEELERMRFGELRMEALHPDEVSSHFECLVRDGFTPEYEREMRRRDGSLIPVSVCAWMATDEQNQPVAVLTRVRDITEQKAWERAQSKHQEVLEAQVAARTRELEDSLSRLRRAERLASVGTLASGLAHQINNPIGSILNASEYALLCEHDDDVHSVWKGALLDAVEQSKRCGRIVRSMLQYSRGEATERWAEDLDVVLQRALNATRGYANARAAEIEVSGNGRPMPVAMNPIEMEQVLVNLINNAIESHPMGSSIRIRLASSEDTVSIDVEDDGRGIADEHQAQIFDPFYSTRVHEGGTGLGLSVAVGIVNEMGGTMTVVSESGVGTTVSIQLPLARFGSLGGPGA